MMHVVVVLGTVIITSLFIRVSAIECYYCESVYDPACGENFDSEEYFKIDCDVMAPPRYIENELASANATACMKRIYKEHATTKFVRSCYFGEVNDTEIGCRMDPTLMGIQSEQCFVCDDDDYCNEASWSHKDRWSALMSLLIFVLTAKLLKLQSL